MRTRLVTARGTAVTVRPALLGDEPFLHALYADRRAPEVDAAGWGPAEARAFVDMQFRAQQAGYGVAFPDAEHWLVSVDGEPAGRLLVDKEPDAHRVVDLVVLSRYRGRGIGTALVAEVIGEASAAGRPVRLTVDAFDRPVVSWYERLGFVRVDETDLYLRMERPLPAGGT